MQERQKVVSPELKGRLEYTVSMLRAEKHYFDIELKVNLQSRTSSIRLAMPVWTPGHYVIEDYPRNVVNLKVKDAVSGKELNTYKETKNVWFVDSKSELSSFTAEYSVYALTYHDTASYTDQHHALINGPSLFIYPIGMEECPVSLKLIPFGNWERVTTSMGRVSDFEFKASNIDELMDSPLEVGNQREYSFRVNGVEHAVSVFGRSALEGEDLVRDLKKIVAKEADIFGGLPYKRYVFIVNFTDESSGGLEHMNSTVCFVPRLRLMPKQEYNITMGIFSHELFHAWNVKRIRPKELLNYDYMKENYTKSLWIAEGVTSYYDDLVLRRAGIFSVPEYLDAFVSNINLMKAYPGSRVQSAEEASFDTWIKFYKSDQNSPNVSMSYYTQGAVIGWMLDMEIRKNTENKKSLDDVMRIIYEEAYLKDMRGYSNDDFERAALNVGGKEVKEVFDSRVRGKEDVDFYRYLGYAGLTLEGKNEKAGSEGFLGVRLSTDGTKTTVGTVLVGYPAESMGIATGDEIIGVDGLRMTGERLGFYISNKQPGSKLILLIARNGEIREIGGKVGRKPTFEYRIVPMKRVSELQKSIFKGWLLEDWKPKIEYPEYRKSPDRRMPFDFI